MRDYIIDDVMEVGTAHEMILITSKGSPFPDDMSATQSLELD